MTADEPDAVDAWLDRENQTTRCTTCKRGEPICGVIRRFLERRAAGTTRRSVPELHQYLVGEFGYQAKIGALDNHLRRCEAGLYEQAFRQRR